MPLTQHKLLIVALQTTGAWYAGGTQLQYARLVCRCLKEFCTFVHLFVVFTQGVGCTPCTPQKNVRGKVFRVYYGVE